MLKKYLLVLLSCFLLVYSHNVDAQCGGIMEPGFAFLTSSRGCAPFTVNIQTLYLSAVPGTVYYVNWGDGTAEQSFTQVNATGVTITHTYPNLSIDCGYDVTIDASNACNPRGSVVPIATQVIVWTNDVISIDPAVYRVCEGFAANIRFTDNSDWNCFPRATRENSEPRWIQWLYGTGPLGSQINGITVNGILPGGFPYLDPAPGRNPIYPVAAPGQQTLPIQVPVTTAADIGKEFVVKLKNWNQCNAYDNNLLDGNAFNPVNGDLIDGDNAPQVTTARIVIVESPQPAYVTRLGSAAGPLQTTFCIGDNIYFDNNTPGIAGASFRYTWEFYDNPSGTGAPIDTSHDPDPVYAYGSPGTKLIRLSVRDQNAAGNCVTSVDAVVNISPSLAAKIQVTDLAGVPMVPEFCQNAAAPFTTFQARFNDASIGTVTATTLWRWEFYDENNVLVRQEPAAGFSSVPIGPFDQSFINRGIYRVVLYVRDNLTSCQTQDEVQVKVFEKPVPTFTATQVCEGQPTTFAESSTLNPTNGETIILKEWDFNYDGVTFTKDPAYDNQSSFTRSLGTAGIHTVALRVTTDQIGCSDIFTLPVTVNAMPLASFTPDVTSGCSVLTVNLTNSSIAGQPDAIDQYIWEVDERQGLGFQPVGVQHPTDPGFSAVFSHDFINTGTSNKIFDIRLHVISINACERISAVNTITVFPGTRSGFISTNYSPFNDNCSPQTVDFSVDNETQSLNPTNYMWNISDINGPVSSTSTGTVPSFSYQFTNTTQALKDYFVTLHTTLSSGCFGDSTRTIRISPVPLSTFSIDTLAFDCNILRLHFKADQSGLQEYHWVIQENSVTVSDTRSSASEAEFEFNRPTAGTADLPIGISLDTKNFANCVSGPTLQSGVVPMKQAINAGFTATPVTQSLPGSTVTINNTTLPGPWQYQWDFGDGTTSNASDAVMSHTYATYGTYLISLKVTSGPCVESAAQTITIQAIPPIVDFTYDPGSGCVPLTVNFTNLTKFADASTYRWEFGDGQGASMAENPTYIYYQPGTYSVSLTASNITGQPVRVTKLLIIEAYPKPVAEFAVKPLLLYIPGDILYTSNRSMGATTFLWDFGDGTTSNEVQPEHTYKNEGVFDISLIATTIHGCSDTTVMNSAVHVQKGGQVLVPNAFSPNTGSSGTAGGSSDGKNDVFLPLTRGVVEFELLVFNRWGELLFESRDPNTGWDGYYHGKLCPQDVYVYKLTAMYENGQKTVRVGDINLIR